MASVEEHMLASVSDGTVADNESADECTEQCDILHLPHNSQQQHFSTVRLLVKRRFYTA